MTTNDGSSQKAHTDWLEDIAETRHLVREALMRLRQSNLHPTTAVLAHEDPQEMAATAHASILDFRDLVEPWGGDIDRWETAALGQCTVYHSSQSAIRAKQRNETRVPGDHIDTALPTESGDLVGLTELEKFESRRITYWKPVAKGFGTSVYSPVEEQMFMPPAVAARAFRQLNSALNDLNLAASAHPQTDTDRKEPGWKEDLPEWAR